jgi:hypothetical protein
MHIEGTKRVLGAIVIDLDHLLMWTTLDMISLSLLLLLLLQGTLYKL